MSTTVSSIKRASLLTANAADRWFRARVERLVRAVPDVPIRIVDSDLEQATAGEIWINVRHPRAYRRILTGGSIGAAEAYMDGDWETNDLVGLCRAFAGSAASLGTLESGLVRLVMPALRLLSAARRNTRRGSRRNIAAHYDLGNDFYAEWLDPTMTYSSACFSRADEDLADASMNKLDRLCRLADLRPGDRVLEIGGGWGSFAVHAAARYGCQVTTTTISREQYAYLTRRVVDAGVSNRVKVLCKDYRDLDGCYDKIFSLEMIEAVGPQYLSLFLKKCAGLLQPRGLLALQAILIRDQDRAAYLRSVDFVRKYVFPGGSLPSLSAIAETATRATDLSLVVLDDITPHYVLTLQRWRKRFLDRADAIRARGFDQRFVRMWAFYLAYCEAGFSERKTTCAQMLLARPSFRSRIEVPS